MLREDWYLRDRLKLRHLYVLVTLCTVGNISRAAQVLHTTQPALSKTLADLEKMLGVRLFERLPSGLIPTKQCLTIVERAKEVFGSLSRVREDIAAIDEGIEGVINIGASTSVTALLLPHIILQLKELLPNVTVSVHDGHFQGLLSDLRSNALDFVIGRTEPATEVDDLEQSTLFDIHMVMLCARHHPILRQANLKLPDLAAWPWIMPPANISVRKGLERLFFEMGKRPPNFGVECGSVLTNAVIMQNTDALAIAAVPTATLFASSGLLSIVPIALPAVFGQISLFQLRGRSLQIRDKLFIDAAVRASSEFGKNYAA